MCNTKNKMNNLVLFLYLLLNEDYTRNYIRLEKRRLRDSQNPFEVPDKLFLMNYRLPKYIIMNLINFLINYNQNTKSQLAIPFHLKFLATIHFLATGSYQNPVGNSAWNCMSQSSVSKAIKSSCYLITNYLMPHIIKFPTILDEKRRVKQGFYNKWGFRGVIGAIDGTHVNIIAPPISDTDHPPFIYINRKGNHSINVMLVCDSDAKILAIDARYPGSVHDAAIWQMSDIKHYLKTEYENGEKNSHLIGDSGYGLEPWLFTPFANCEEGSPEALYNAMHKSARNVIERTNGILKGRFRCLSKHRVLNYHPSQAAYIIYSCAILHNIAVNAKIPCIDIEYDDIDNNEYDHEAINGNVQDNNLLQIGQWTRSQYINSNLLK